MSLAIVPRGFCFHPNHLDLIIFVGRVLSTLCSKSAVSIKNTISIPVPRPFALFFLIVHPLNSYGCLTLLPAVSPLSSAFVAGSLPSPRLLGSIPFFGGGFRVAPFQPLICRCRWVVRARAGCSALLCRSGGARGRADASSCRSLAMGTRGWS